MAELQLTENFFVSAPEKREPRALFLIKEMAMDHGWWSWIIVDHDDLDNSLLFATFFKVKKTD